MKQSAVITAAADVIASNGGQDGPVRAAPGARNPGPVERDLRWIAAELARGSWPDPEAGLFTAEEFGEVVLGAAGMLEAELGLGERDHDLLTLLIGAVGVRLSVPDAGLDAVIARVLPDKAPAAVRGWWDGWS